MSLAETPKERALGVALAQAVLARPEPFMLEGLTRGMLEDAGLACKSGAIYFSSYFGHIRLTSSPSKEAGLIATDGHRMHATRSALEEGTSHVCWLPVRALEALALLERNPGPFDALEVGSWGTKDKVYISSHEGEFFAKFPDQCQAGPDLEMVRGIVEAIGNGSRDIVAIERSWKAHKLSSFKGNDLVLLSGSFPLSGEPRSATTLRVWAWPSFDEERPLEVREAREMVLRQLGTDRRLVLRASYVRDAVRFVSDGGDDVTVSIPESGKSGFGEGALVLASRSRLALVMPMNASIA